MDIKNNNYLNINAIYSDETINFTEIVKVYNIENIFITIRVGKENVDKVLLCYEDKEIEMKKFDTNDLFDYYKGEIKNVIELTTYYFKIIKGDSIYFYNKKGVTSTLESVYNFLIIPNFETPSWAKGAVMYQIYVDRFFNGDNKNDVLDREYYYLGRHVRRANWEDDVQSDDVFTFYGGDLQGVLEKLDYLKDLGVEAIYFNPLFVSPSNHKYDAQDYDYVDPHLAVIIDDGGQVLSKDDTKNINASMYIKRTTDKKNLIASNEFVIKLVETAHKKGIKVIFDGVFNHCGSFNKWLDCEGIYREYDEKGAFWDESSPYISYFLWNSQNWTEEGNSEYSSWWGHKNHPKLNFEESSKLYNYILQVGKKWVSPPYNADGWRLDVASDLGQTREFNHKFWKDFRKAVKEANKDAIIISENYGDSFEWLLGDEWDTIMNYSAFMEPITWFLTGLEKHSDEYREDLFNNSWAFINSMKYNMSRMPIQALEVSMNQLSNHDHSRFLTRTNRKVGRLHTLGKEAAEEGINKGIMKEAITFQMTWIGAPTLYYGDEAGLCGFTDPDNRRPYPWGKEDFEILNFYKYLIKIRKENNVLKSGSLEYLLANNGIISYGRFNKNEKIVVILNNNSQERCLEIPVWKLEVFDGECLKEIVLSKEESFSTGDREFNVKDGKINIFMPSYSSSVLINKK